MNGDDNIRVRKISLLKLIIIIVDIIAVIGIVFSYLHERKAFSSNNEKTSIYSFKKFSYNVPKSIKFESLDMYKFKLSNDNWKANIEIFINYNDYILNHPKKYYKIIRDNDYDVNKYQKKVIDGETVIIYNGSSKSDASICYLKTVSPFWYEIQLYNDGGFDIKILEKIVKILVNGTYDNKSDKLYSYYEFIAGY